MHKQSAVRILCTCLSKVSAHYSPSATPISSKSREPMVPVRLDSGLAWLSTVCQSLQPPRPLFSLAKWCGWKRFASRDRPHPSTASLRQGFPCRPSPSCELPSQSFEPLILHDHVIMVAHGFLKVHRALCKVAQFNFLLPCSDRHVRGVSYYVKAPRPLKR